MRLFPMTIAAALLASSAATAFAATPHLTDVQFVEANRCAGLMSSKTLGTADAAAMEALLKHQNFGRDGFVYDKGDEARDDAANEANHAGGDRKARLISERDGVCQSLLGLANTTTAGATSSNSSFR